jgi:hypothetical protein
MIEIHASQTMRKNFSSFCGVPGSAAEQHALNEGGDSGGIAE